MRICNLVWKEFIQFLRDWLMTLFIFTLPALQLVLMANATGSRISDLCTAVLDGDRSSTSRRLVTALDNREELNVCYFPDTLADARHLLDQGEAALAVVIPNDFAASLSGNTPSPGLQIVADASNNITGQYALAGAKAAIAGLTSDLAREAGFPRPNAESIIDVRITERYNAGLDIRPFTISAQVGFIVYQVTLIVAAIGLARERELGTLEQLMVMPLRRIELIVGKAIPALIVGVLNFVVLLIVAILGFDLPMRGSLALLCALTLLFIAVEIGYGVLISSVARTQQQAVLFVFVLAMVDMSFSGYMVRIKNLPVMLQAIAQVVPFYHYLTIIRGVMLKGAGLNVLWPHAAAMALTGGTVTALAIHALRRTGLSRGE
ncbi:MAG TPA: ABC transporter permease [Chloroflexi bacterium]|nr:ABC transporter permease [Chloroflexota bacterium]